MNVELTAGKVSSGAMAKMTALAAAAALPGPDPVPTVSYRSGGKTLLIGAAGEVAYWAAQLPPQLATDALLTDGQWPPGLPLPPGLNVHCGGGVSITGWLGNFSVECSAGMSLTCDLILDLSQPPLMRTHQPAPGYFAPARGRAERAEVLMRLGDMIGEFEKPKYFAYKEKLCAHGRNRKIGCSACIDICSAGAIESAGNRIAVNSHLCAGCGACTTVCPSGALRYAYPAAAYSGERLRTVIRSYCGAGGEAPVILFHSEGAGQALLADLETVAQAAGEAPVVPDHIIPLALHHTASVGIDVWLAALAYGAGGIVVLMTDEEAPQYRSAVRQQMEIAQIILSGLGYRGEHLQLIAAAEPVRLAAILHAFTGGGVPARPASFHLQADKRNTLDLALGHLVAQAPLTPAQIELPAGAPFGAVKLNQSACSLCMSCVGACPSMALLDSPATPRLSFVEKNCVQCGLCAVTCPEDAISLLPRMSFADTWNKAVVLHESEPFCCIRCNKPFGTLQAVQAIIGKLSGHAAFAGNLDRLKMCGDCRVVDMMQSNKS